MQSPQTSQCPCFGQRSHGCKQRLSSDIHNFRSVGIIKRRGELWRHKMIFSEFSPNVKRKCWHFSRQFSYSVNKQIPPWSDKGTLRSSTLQQFPDSPNSSSSPSSSDSSSSQGLLNVGKPSDIPPYLANELAQEKKLDVCPLPKCVLQFNSSFSKVEIVNFSHDQTPHLKDRSSVVPNVCEERQGLNIVNTPISAINYQPANQALSCPGLKSHKRGGVGKMWHFCPYYSEV